MQRVLIGLAVLSCLVVGTAYSGAPHFVSCTAAYLDPGVVCLAGLEEGLGDKDQVEITLTVVAYCQNRGNNDPSVQKKETFGSMGTFHIQNGRALYELCVETEFLSDCTHSMTVVVDAVTLVDTTNSISCSQASQ